MKYEVHIYAIVRVKVVNVEAESQQEAIRKAEARCDLYALVQQSDREPNSEYAENKDVLLSPLCPDGYQRTLTFMAGGRPGGKSACSRAG